jgi:hypothetical protein
MPKAFLDFHVFVLVLLLVFMFFISYSLQITPLPLLPADNKYDIAEPRQLAGSIEEIDIVIPNESRHPRYSQTLETNFGVWRKNSWITKPPSRQKRSTARFMRTAVITPQNFTDTLMNGQKTSREVEKSANFTKVSDLIDELRHEDSSQNVSREIRELTADDNLGNLFPVDSKMPNRNWQSKEYITREMEDVFLQGASQALTRYIERQLHPAIKETLMLSMGYTISYG